MQIDLYDKLSCLDKENNWRSLKKVFSYKRKQDVVRDICIIVWQFGSPVFLQSDNGKEFRNKLLESFKLLWPFLDIVDGRQRKPQGTQGNGLMEISRVC